MAPPISSANSREPIEESAFWNVSVVEGSPQPVLNGMLATAARYVAVMDTDLQHNERILPEMLERIKAGELDIVVASRRVAGGSMGEFSRRRIWLSALGMQISRRVSHSDISDPMSGFFLV